MTRKITPLKDGLLEPKHVKQIGNGLWEFCWLLRGITFEVELESGEKVGFVKGGAPVSHSWIAGELGRSERTVRRHLARFEKYSYITRPKSPGIALPIIIRKSAKWPKLSKYVRQIPWTKVAGVLESAGLRLADPRTKLVPPPDKVGTPPGQNRGGSNIEGLKGSRKGLERACSAKENTKPSNPETDPLTSKQKMEYLHQVQLWNEGGKISRNQRAYAYAMCELRGRAPSLEEIRTECNGEEGTQDALA